MMSRRDADLRPIIDHLSVSRDIDSFNQSSDDFLARLGQVIGCPTGDDIAFAQSRQIHEFSPCIHQVFACGSEPASSLASDGAGCNVVSKKRWNVKPGLLAQ